MSDLNSIWDDPRITAFVLGELNEQESVAFREEMETHPELAAAVEEARSVTGRLTELYAAEPTTELDSDRRETITRESTGETSTRNTAAAAPTGSSDKNSRRSAMPKVLLATAAAVLLLVGIAPLLNRQQAAKVSQLDAEEARKSAEGEMAMAEIPDEDSDGLHDLEGTTVQTPDFNFVPERLGEAASSEGLIVDDRVAMPPVQNQSAMPADQPVSTATESFALGLTPAPRSAPAPSSGRQAGKSDVAKGATPTKPHPFSEPEPLTRMMVEMEEEAGTAVLSEVKAEMRAQANFFDPQPDAMFGGMGGAAPMRGRPAIVPAQPRGQRGNPTPNYGLPIDEGRGPGIAGDRFDPITDNPFKRVSEHPLSTFSIDVDTASYSKVRDFLQRANQLPRPDAVRIEELVNYFDYNYQPPANDAVHPFAADTVITDCPWNDEHQLARIALKGKTMSAEERPRANLVFLLDTSGSMNAPNKLPLVVDGMKMLLKQLNKDDKVAITVYAGSAGLVLDSTKAAKKKKIRKALTQLRAGGSTNGGSGISLAYQTARDNFISDGVNRVILCTDGDFNVGTTGTDQLVRMVEREAKGGIFLSVLGFGMGNHNDAMLEQISNRGNGNYSFIDTDREARKVLVEQTSATLVTIAKDVKIQVEFNPRHVSSYRLIGYENRILAKEDFNDDQKDAGEIGAGHSVTALYELVPAGKEPDAAKPKVDDLTFQTDPELTEAAQSDRWMLLKLRYKQPDGDTSTLVKFPVTPAGTSFEDADPDVRFAAAVAGFGMQLRRSEYQGDWTLSDVRKTAEKAVGQDRFGLRGEFVKLVEKAADLMGEE